MLKKGGINMFLQEDLEKLVKNIYHSNLTNKSSKIINIKRRNTSIAGFPTKQDMLNNTRGVVFNDYATLLKALEEGQISHITPNSFKYKSIKKLSNGNLVGYTEENLFSINCFFVDIDKKIDQTQLELKLIDSGIYPSLILRTDRGYQCFWLLDKPFFVDKEKKTLKIAKQISQNIRLHLKSLGLEVDEYCNDLLLARAPKLSNIVNIIGSYSLKELMTFSKKVSKANIPTINSHIKSVNAQVDQNWYKALISTNDVPTGVRNTAAFTLALANKQSQRPLNETLTTLLTWNNRLTYPLKVQEIKRLVKSAFDKPYNAAHSTYIKLLIEDCNLNVSYTSSYTTFWEPAKPREERIYSHLIEWQADLMHYLSKKLDKGRAYLATSKTQIMEDVKIPKRSLDKLLIKLKKEGRLTYKSKAGRGGGLLLATRDSILKALINSRKKKVSFFVDLIQTEVSFDPFFVQKVYLQEIKNQPRSIQGKEPPKIREG